MSDVSQWNVSAASNNSAAPDGAPEGMAPSGVNDTMREMMAAVARWYSDTDGSLTSTGSANAYALTTNNAHAALADQSILVFRASFGNTGAATLNVDALGAKSIRMAGAALTSGTIVSGAIVVVAYNATADAYDLIAPNISATNLTVGTLPDARLSFDASDIAFESEANTFTAANDFTATFSGGSFAINIEAAIAGWRLRDTNAGTDEKEWFFYANGDFKATVADDSGSGEITWLTVQRTGTTIGSVNFNNGTLQYGGSEVVSVGATQTITGAKTFTGAVRAGLTTRSTSSTLAMGQIHSRSANTTVETAAAGNWVAIYNSGTSSITLTQGSGLTLQLAGVNGTTGSRTLDAKGFAFIWYDTASVAVCGGSGVS